MSRRINCKPRSEAGVVQSGLSLSDGKYVKGHKGQETIVLRDASSPYPVSKVKYSLRSGHRQASSSVGSRCAQRPMAFVSQSRERYLSDEDDNNDSTSFADDESERSAFLPEADGESTDFDSDEIHRHTTSPHIPDITDDVNIPSLILPESAFDLVIDTEVSLKAVCIYQVLRQFSRVLHLSLFRFEDFCSALVVNEQSCLLAETHIALLKCILQEEDCSNSTFGPTDAKDSINISLYVIDAVTWFEAVSMYLESLTDIDDDFQQVLGLFSCSHYQDLKTSQRLLLLQILTDLFLATNLVREAIMKEGAFIHEEQCRFCHRRGDLICCETCPAVFHLECLKPPLTAVPDDEWFCCVCSAFQVKGVNECLSDIKKGSLLSRLEPIGYDRHHRKYWFLCRRVFVEADGRTWYYSTPAQLEELMLALDDKRWEVDLVAALKAIKSVIVGQMAITEELTNKVKGKRNSALAAHDEILKAQRLNSKCLLTINEENNVEQAVVCSEEDRKPNNILNQDCIEAKLEEGFGVQDLMKPEETESFRAENGKEISNAPKVSNCQSQGKEVGSEESKKLDTAHEVLAGDIIVESDIMILKNDNNSSTVADSADAAIVAVPTAASVSDLAEVGQQKFKAKSEESNLNITAESPQELHSVTESVPLAESIKKLSSDTAVEMSSSLASDAISEMRQTRSKSKHLVGVNTFEADTSSNREQHFRPDPMLFKLGMEGNYKTYVNLYSTNPLALSKQQQNDDREKRRHLSYKFSLTPLSEFVWSGIIYGQSRQTVDAVKRILLNLEASIDQCFLHPNWCQNCGRWQKAVSLCSTAADFGLALMILEACMKPVLFNSVWHESLGHIKLRRTTAAEKEEQKKKERELKRIRYEDECLSSTWVKYSLGLHHQVWKQKGEEYRSTGKGGWFWVSSTRVKQPTNFKNCSLFQILRKNCQSDKVDVFSKTDRSVDTAINQESDREFIQPCTEDRKDSAETSVSNDINQITDRTEINVGAFKLGEVENEEHESHLEKHAEVQFLDSFDVSEALLSRSLYKKKSAIHCVLDGLLERRTKQLELELEQKAALELALQKFHAEALKEYSQQKGSSSCADSHSGLYSGKSKTLDSPKSGSYVAKLNFAKQKIADSEHSKDRNEDEKEEEEGEENGNSDNEVTLEKEDLDDNSSVESSAARCQAEDIVMSEDSNASNASSLAANIIPPPVQSKSFRHTLLEQKCSLTPFQEASVGDNRPFVSAAVADATQIEISCSHNVINSLQKYIKDGNIILTKAIAKEIKEKLKEVGKTQFQFALLKQISSVNGKKKRKQIKRGSIPRAQNFLTKSNKRSLFVLESDELALLARKGGQKEALGFNYACKVHDISWPYPFPRPYFKAAWKYRTHTAKNLSAIALQLRILWANIRWDDMAVKCTAGKNTTVSETELTAVELLKRRDIGPTNLRAEYLIQKTVSPLDVPVSNKERVLPPQRSGLRERRHQETPISREPVISEFWVPEEQLELWQVKLFAERLEKKQNKQKEKASEKKAKTTTLCGKLQESICSVSRISSQNLLEKKMTAEPIVKVGSAAVEEELQQQRMLMRQSRLLGLSLLRGERSDDQMISSPSPSTRDSITSAARTYSQSATPRSLKLPFRRLGVPKTNNNITVSRSASMTHPVVSYPVPAPQSICLSGPVSQCLPSAANAPMLSPPPPPPMSSSSPATSPVVQSIRIRKGPDGQLQITGLQPGQEIIRLLDGRLRLVAKPLPIDGSSNTPLKITSPSAQPNDSPEESCNTVKVDNLQSQSSLDVQQKKQKRKESDSWSRPEQVLTSADKQTSVTVATAVEKLFACLSPLRLQNKQRFAEKAVCNRQSPSEEAAHEGHFMMSATGDPVMVDASAESVHVSTAGSMQSKDVVVLSGLGSPSQTESTCLSLPTDKQTDHSDKRSDECPIAMVPEDDQPDSHSKSQYSTWKGEACSETADAGSLLVRQKPSSAEADLADEVGIGNRRTSRTELGIGIPRINVNAPGSKTACSGDIQGSRKRKREGSLGTAAVQEELPAPSRTKDTDYKSMIGNQSEENQSSSFNRSKTTDNKTVSDNQLIDQAIRGSCKRKLSGPGIIAGIGEPLKKHHPDNRQLTGEKSIRQPTGENKGGLDVNRCKLDRRDDNGEPSVLSPQTSKKQSKKINAGIGISRNCNVKQNLRQLATDEKEKLLCICRTPYDPSRFYVGCDICLSWFHGSCVNISQKEVLAIGSFVCAACTLQQSNNGKGTAEELFCICHQPYDDSQFYIGCNDCGGWFHGSCVAISPSDVGRMDCYTCPTCNIKRGCSRVELHEQHLSSLKKLISTLKLNSLTKPLCKLTKKAENEGYSEVINKGIDFSVVEQKIESGAYFLLEDFVTDVLVTFSNCRVYNNRKSPMFSRAIEVERQFVSQFEKLKTEVFQV